MNSYTLPFATINILRDDIAEVIIDEGIEMNLIMVDQYHDFLLSHLKSPFSLLINKKNAYTYEFEAQKKLASLSEINRLSVVVYSDLSRLGQNALSVNLDGSVNEKVCIFTDREEALLWLLKKQDNLSLA